jgi:uncharacterized phiE125 gp8 family phage protein
MPSGLQRISGPASEPVSVTEALAWLRQDDPTDSALVASLITAARIYLEGVYDLTMVQTTWKSTIDRFPRYSSSAVWQYNSDAIWSQRLPVTQLSGQWYPDRASIRVARPPLVSVSSITYIDGFGNLQTVDPSIYNVDTTTPRGRIAPAYGQIWPIVRQQLASVQVTYTAGYADASSVPETLKTAVKMMVLWMYEHRGDDNMQFRLPLTVENLMLSEWDGEYN